MKEVVINIMYNWYAGQHGEEYRTAVVGQNGVKEIYSSPNRKHATIHYDDGFRLHVTNVNQCYVKIVPDDEKLPF